MPIAIASGGELALQIAWPAARKLTGVSAWRLRSVWRLHPVGDGWTVNIRTDIVGFMNAAAIIKDARARAGLTQAALARAAGTSQPTLAAYESGAKSPSVRTLDKIVRAAGFSLDAVLHAAPAAGGAVLAEVRIRQADIRKAAAGYGIRNVRVFGSAARGDARPDSDIDLLVDFDAERHGLGPLAGFRAEVRGLLDRDVDVATLALLREDVRAEAETQAVPL